MKKEITEYMDKCLTYQKVKAEHQHLVGKWRPLEIMSLPLSAWKKNAIWVIADRFTKSAYFLPIRDS